MSQVLNETQRAVRALHYYMCANLQIYLTGAFSLLALFKGCRRSSFMMVMLLFIRYNKKNKILK